MDEFFATKQNIRNTMTLINEQDCLVNRAKLFTDLSVKVERLLKLVVVLLTLVSALVFVVVQHQYRIHYLEKQLLSRDSHVIQLNKQGPGVINDDLESSEFNINDASGRNRKLPNGRSHPVEQTEYRESTGESEVSIPSVSRQRRDVKSSRMCNISVSSLLQKYCSDREKKETPVKVPEYLSLRNANFEASFYILFPYDSFKTGNGEYIESLLSNLPSPVTVYKDNRIHFSSSGSPLGIYRSVNESMSSPLVQINITNGEFKVKTPGTYTVHVNSPFLVNGMFLVERSSAFVGDSYFQISLVDETSDRSIGLFQNDQLMLACPPGGIVCTSNLPDSGQYRICNIAGILKLKSNDTIQLKTMLPDTTIRLRNRQKSVFFIALIVEDH